MERRGLQNIPCVYCCACSYEEVAYLQVAFTCGTMKGRGLLMTIPCVCCCTSFPQKAAYRWILHDASFGFLDISGRWL
jgi:hypothetical protein